MKMQWNKKIETVSKKAQMLDLPDKGFKSAILSMLKGLKETMSKD